MTDRVFVDANILVYGFDRLETEKQLKAIEILNRLFASRLGVISTKCKIATSVVQATQAWYSHRVSGLRHGRVETRASCANTGGFHYLLMDDSRRGSSKFTISVFNLSRSEF